MKEQEPVGKKGRFWRISGWLVLVLIMAGNSYLIWQMQSVVSRVDKYNQGVIDEIGDVKGDVKAFSDDLNEIRRFLLLPQKQYSVNNAGQGSAENALSENNSDNTVALYAMLDTLSKEQKVNQNKSVAQPVEEALLANPDFLKALDPLNLVLGNQADLLVKFNDSLAENPDGSMNTIVGEALFALVFDGETNLFKVQSALGEKEFSDYSQADFADQLLNYLRQNVQAVRAKKIADIVAGNQLKEQTEKQLKQDLEDQKQQLADALHEPAFQDGLAALGWKVAEKNREENNKYIFDLLDAQNKVQVSIALEISSGMVKLIRNGQEIDVKNFLDLDGSKKNF